MGRGERFCGGFFGLTFGFLSLGRTGAYQPLAYRHTFVCLMLVVEPTSPVRALNKSLLKQKSRDNTLLFYLRGSFGLTFGFLSLGRTGAYKPSAYRHTSVCLMLVVKPTSPVRILINPYLKQKSRDKTPLFYLRWVPLD